MKLRGYQEDAVERICESMKTSFKLRVEIGVGLGRNVIIAALLRRLTAGEANVLVLTPNRNTCYQIRENFGDEKYAAVVLDRKEYTGHGILITTYHDLEYSRDFDTDIFHTVICDGIYYLDQSTIQGKFRDKGICFIGFTSQVGAKASGWFGDAVCVFQYGLRTAIDDGYAVKGFDFETVVYKILKKQGYGVDIVAQRKDIGYDFQADKGEEHFAIEVKRWDRSPLSRDALADTAERLEKAAKRESRTPMLISANPDLEKERTARTHLLPLGKTVIVSIQNLMYMARGDLELENSLNAVLGYSSGELEPVSPPILLDHQAAGTEEATLIRFMDLVRSWDAQKESSVKYEELCYEVLRVLFVDDLTLWNRQRRANDGLFRFDLICKIKNGNVKDFWKILEEYFRSKYIVFEFKNYKKPITQNEIIITEKYLYAKALRGVAIIISANGANANAERTVRGLLRDDGKLIIILSNNDLAEMLKRKMEHEDPADYLSEKLDELFIHLEK